MRHVPIRPLLSTCLFIALGMFGSQQIQAATSPSPVAAPPLVARGLNDHPVSHVPANAACTPRPKVTVSTRVESGRLRVDVGTTTSSEVAVNAIQVIRFGMPSNARVRLENQATIAANREVGLPTPAATYAFYVERTAGGAAHVPFTVIDACGEWPTFVGAGPSALPMAAIPTQTPTATPRPAPSPLHDTRFWHAPTDHEHGDPPPQWIMDAGYSVAFDHHDGFHGNTSSAENTTKHAAMKGFSATMKGVDLYFRVHIASNVLDRMARYHSYEIWARDPSGGVSHWQGWFNSGDPVADRISRTQPDPGRRPVVLVVDADSLARQIGCEQWYASTASWSWDFGWTVCGTTTVYYPGENEQTAVEHWRPTGASGAELRRLEAAWYDNSHGRLHPVGKFWATQFGEGVSGPHDLRCSRSTTKYGVTYQNVCLEQYIAPTMTEVAFPDNAIQKPFGAPGLRLGN